jgi:hypothetical protein
MRHPITIRPPRRDFTIPNWAFLLVGGGGGRPIARRLGRAVRERIAGRPRLKL